MSIKYKIVEEVNPLDPEGEKIKVYQHVPTGFISYEEILQMVVAQTGLPYEELKKVLDANYEKILQSLIAKQPTPFFGMGNIVYKEKRVKVSLPNSNKSEFIYVAGYELEPSTDFLIRLENVKIERVDEDG